MKELIRAALQEVLKSEMDDTLGASPYERSSERRGHRSGYYERSLVTRMVKIELRVPRDCDGQFSANLFERYQRGEKALMEMCLQGVSTRKVSKITEELCGTSFSAATVSELNCRLDGALAKFAGRRLDEEYPYLILDARYEKVRVDGIVQSQAVLIALGGLSVELANRESSSSWKYFLLKLKGRGLSGVEYVVSDDHPGLKRAIREVLHEATWQRCHVHFLRNALDMLPRKCDPDCLTELRWLYDRGTLEEVRRDLAAWLAKWQGKYSKFCDWAEENIEETLSLYKLPPAHRKRLKSTNMLERLNEDSCPRPRRGDPRGVDGGHALSQHERIEGAQEANAAGRGRGGLTFAAPRRGNSISPPMNPPDDRRTRMSLAGLREIRKKV